MRQNLGELTTKLQEVPNAQPPNGVPKTFTQHYELKKMNAQSSVKKVASKLGYRNIADGVTKSEARTLLKNNTFGLTSEQIARIKHCLGDGRADKVNIKIDNYGMARLSMERPGHTSGFQRMSYKIDKNGVKTTLVQTAYNNDLKLVHQKPGKSKNNVYDVKKNLRKK